MSEAALPDWATKPFYEFLDHKRDLAQVLLLSINGISMLRGRYQAIKVLREIEDEGAETCDELKAAAEQKTLAQREVDKGFPLLHEQATVFLWGSLEALIRSFVASWLGNRQEAWQSPDVKKLKVNLGDYEALDPGDRCLWVVDLLDKATGAPLRVGVNRFDELLRPFGLQGPFPDDAKKTLFELSQVRNALMHRRGRADRRLIDACPWLELSPGDQIEISHKMWRRYNSVVGMYVLKLIDRVGEAFGFERLDLKDKPSLPD